VDSNLKPRQLAEGLWAWAAPHPEWTPERGGVGGWEPEVTAWLLESDSSTILIDPLLPSDPADLQWVERRCADRSVHALVTVYWHLRSAEIIQARLGARVWGNAKTREDVEHIVTGLIEDQVPLPGGVVPFTPIPNHGGEDETAFWLPRQHALAVGDILIRTPEGVRIWWEQKTDQLQAEYHDRVLPSLDRLLDLPIELLLLPHGGPIVENAHEALAVSLRAPTWQHPPQ
jgi:hypothetical protein